MDDALREAKQIARDVTIEELRQGRAGRGLASVVAVSANRQAEVGLIGCEGMTGLGVVLGGEIAPYKIVVKSRVTH